MKHGYTVVRKHGSDRWEVALGPECSNREHRNFFRTRRRARADAQYAEVAYLQEINSVKLDRLVAQKVIEPEGRRPFFAPIQPPPAPTPGPARPPAKPKGFQHKLPAKKPESVFGARLSKE